MVFVTGVALPLLVEGVPNSRPAGRASSARPRWPASWSAPIALGGLADIYGRRYMFVVEMVVFVLFLIGLNLAPDLVWMVVFLFGVGLALGCDYPTAHLVISESIASKDRGRLVLGAFAFQAIGALVGTGAGLRRS